MKVGNNDVCPDSAPAILRAIPGRKHLAGQHSLVQPQQRAVLKQEPRSDQHKEIESRNEPQKRVRAAHPGTAAVIRRCRSDRFHFWARRRSKRGLIVFFTQAIDFPLLASYLHLRSARSGVSYPAIGKGNSTISCKSVSTVRSLAMPKILFQSVSSGWQRKALGRAKKADEWLTSFKSDQDSRNSSMRPLARGSRVNRIAQLSPNYGRSDRHRARHLRQFLHSRRSAPARVESPGSANSRTTPASVCGFHRRTDRASWPRRHPGS